MTFKKAAVTCALLGALTGEAQGSGMGIGMRGTTDYQIDQRFTYSESAASRAAVSNTILKYWPGKDFGPWLSVAIPYKHANSPKGSKSGMGDINVSAGPRGVVPIGDYGNLHAWVYGSATFPTAKNGMGKNRTDVKFGTHTSFRTRNDGVEVGTSADYTMTGNGAPNETFAGVLAGNGKGKLRAMGGFTASSNGASRDIRLRAVGRYTGSKRWHAEVWGEKSVKHRGVKGTSAATILIRYNPGKF